MSNIRYKKRLDAIHTTWMRLLAACALPDHILFEIYDRIAGDLECTCCVFYRGVILGLVAQALLISFFFLLGQLS